MMQKRRPEKSNILALIVLLLGAAGLLLSNVAMVQIAAATVVTQTGDEVETFDRLHLTDGRILEGKIVEETRTTIVFQIVDQAIGLSVTREIDRRDIREIERDIARRVDRPVEEIEDRDLPEEEERPLPDRARGLGEGDPNDESLPAFYVLPMRGQMGTDVHPDVYRHVVEDIERTRPDVVIWRMNCQDVSELEHRLAGPDSVLEFTRDPERSLEFLLDEYRELVRMLHDDLPRDIRQVMWVEDSYGLSSLIALAWDELYMTPGARLGGIRRLVSHLDQIGDEDVKQKMISATLGIAAGFLHRGNRDRYADTLVQAMCIPERQLSASWRGREVIWRLDARGDYIVNSDRELTAEFRAGDAENLAISKGTAESIDDLALLLGYREYRVLEGDAHRVIQRHREDWRRAWERAQTLIREYQEFQQWASGDRAVQWLGRARGNLESIISLMNRYPAVEIRFQMQYGPNRFALEMMVENLRDQITRMRQGGRGGGGRGGGGGGGVPPRGPR